MLKKEWSCNLFEFFLGVDQLFFLLIIQMGVHTPSPWREEAIALTLDGSRKMVNLNCSFLLPPIRMSKSLIRT
jgi:hypothetical protein